MQDPYESPCGHELPTHAIWVTPDPAGPSIYKVAGESMNKV